MVACSVPNKILIARIVGRLRCGRKVNCCCASEKTAPLQSTYGASTFARSVKLNGSAQILPRLACNGGETLHECDGAPPYALLWKTSWLKEPVPEEDVPIVALEEFLSKR